MKIFLWLAFVSASLCVPDAPCETLKEDLVDVCVYDSLILTSSPSKRVVDCNSCNAEFDKSEWQREPTVSFPDAQPDKVYALLCVDPDPPKYTKGQYYLHWLVTNINGEDLKEGDLSTSKHLKTFYGPAPPENSGIHRYMFVLFEQKNKNCIIENPVERSRFELLPWLHRNSDLIGPVAGIQFRTKY